MSLKKMSEAYLNFQKARTKMFAALRDMENLSMIRCPDQYSDGYYKRLNELESLVDNISTEPMARAMQSSIRDSLYKRSRK